MIILYTGRQDVFETLVASASTDWSESESEDRNTELVLTPCNLDDSIMRLRSQDGHHCAE